MQEAEPPLPPPPQPPPEEPPQPQPTGFACAPSRPAGLLVQNALRPECSVDFPQITEICERLEMQPGELKGAVAVLKEALKDPRQPLRVKLKALTIANEMLYNPRAVQELALAEGLREALETLRQTRGGELGPAMDENVRMLATEVEARCFEKPKDGWSSFTKAMSSDFEKARRLAKKNSQHLWQKAEKHLEKAEKAFEKGATKLMQEAENMLVGPGPTDEGAERAERAERLAPARRNGPALTQEEEELQWALRASLVEAQRSRKEAPKAEPGRSVTSRSGQEPKHRCKAMEAQLSQQLALQAKSAKEVFVLNAKLEEANEVAESLASELSEAEVELAILKQRRQALEEELAMARSLEACDEASLRCRVQKLELELSQTSHEARPGLGPIAKEEDLVAEPAEHARLPSTEAKAEDAQVQQDSPSTVEVAQDPPPEPAEASMAFSEAKVEEPEVNANAADRPQHEEDPPPQPTEASVVSAEAKVEEPDVKAVVAVPPKHEEDPPPQPTEASVVSAEAKVEEPEVKSVAADPPKHEEDPPPQPTEASVVSAEAKVEELEVKAVAADLPKHEEDPPPQPTEASVVSAEAKAGQVEEPEVKEVAADPPKHEDSPAAGE
ncbi:unnamed protein product [Durusdinium trenchii]|uniref:Uncharacterized protein n=1 Tax=Durusdinium trenchii TaxID=1381693 RepID=A0ABP0I7T9_9DINO